MQHVRRLSIHLFTALNILSDPPQIGEPLQIPFLRPSGQPLTTFQRVHARIGLETKTDTRKPLPRAIALLGGSNIFTIWTQEGSVDVYENTIWRFGV